MENFWQHNTVPHFLSAHHWDFSTHQVDTPIVQVKATSIYQSRESTCSTPYLDLDNNDAQYEPTDIVTVDTSQSKCWEDFDINYTIKPQQAGKPNLVWAMNKDIPVMDVCSASKAVESHNVLCKCEPPSPRSVTLQTQYTRKGFGKE